MSAKNVDLLPTKTYIYIKNERTRIKWIKLTAVYLWSEAKKIYAIIKELCYKNPFIP